MKTPPFLRSAHNYDTDQASDLSGLLCEDESLAQQQFKDECDINTIVARFGLTGELPSDVRMPQYADFDEIYDFHSAQNILAAANQEFMRLPPKLRERFGHDPQNLLMFLNDTSNRDEAVKLGLVNPIPATPEKTAPEPVKTVTEKSA